MWRKNPSDFINEPPGEMFDEKREALRPGVFRTPATPTNIVNQPLPTGLLGGATSNSDIVER